MKNITIINSFYLVITKRIGEVKYFKAKKKKERNFGIRAETHLNSRSTFPLELQC